MISVIFEYDFTAEDFLSIAKNRLFLIMKLKINKHMLQKRKAIYIYFLLKKLIC